MGPEHVAPVVAWLLSGLTSDITGRIFGVHGARVFEYAMNQSDGMEAPDGAWTPEALSANLKAIAL